MSLKIKPSHMAALVALAPRIGKNLTPAHVLHHAISKLHQEHFGAGVGPKGAKPGDDDDEDEREDDDDASASDDNEDHANVMTDPKKAVANAHASTAKHAADVPDRAKSGKASPLAKWASTDPKGAKANPAQRRSR